MFGTQEKRKALKGYLIMLWECSRLRLLIRIELRVLYNTLGGGNGQYT